MLKFSNVDHQPTQHHHDPDQTSAHPSIILKFTHVDHKPTQFPPVYGYQNHPTLPLRQALEPVLPRIHGLDEFIRIAKNECHFPSEHDLTREESASIYIYTMDWGEQSLYQVLNAVLRIRDRSELVPWHGYLKLFDSALKKLPSRDICLWRGINVDVSKNFKKKEELTWWSFSSCSPSVNVIQQFLGPVSTLLMIQAKNGKSISAYSNFPEENEVILGLGTRLRVVSNALDHPSIKIVHLIELSSDNEEYIDDSRYKEGLKNVVKQSHGGIYELRCSKISWHDFSNT